MKNKHTLRFKVQRYKQRSEKALKMLGGRLSSALHPGDQPPPVVMFHIGRSGSTVLCDLLGQHPSVYWDGEALDRFWIKKRKFGRRIADEDAPQRAEAFLKRSAMFAGRRIYGYEAKFHHLYRINMDLTEYVQMLRRLGVTRCIVLKRKNYLRKIISSRVRHPAQRGHITAREQPALHPIAIDPQNVYVDGRPSPLLSFFNEWDTSFNKVHELLDDIDVLNLTFEDHVAPDPRIGYGEICAFLDIPPQPVAVRYGRTNPFPLRDIILNYDEVASALEGTPYAWMIHE